MKLWKWGLILIASACFCGSMLGCAKKQIIKQSVTKAPNSRDWQEPMSDEEYKTMIERLVEYYEGRVEK